MRQPKYSDECHVFYITFVTTNSHPILLQLGHESTTDAGRVEEGAQRGAIRGRATHQ